MSLWVKELNYLEFLVHFTGIDCPMLRYYASLISFQEDLILGLFDQDDLVGGAILLRLNAPEGCTELVWLQIIEKYQRQGLGRFLLNESIGWAKRIGKNGVTLRIVETHPFWTSLTAMAEKCGFSPIQSAKIVRCRLNDETFERWNRISGIMNQKLCGRLTQQGFLCCSLADAPPSLMEQLHHGESFQKSYSPAPYLHHLKNQLMPACSYLAYAGNRPAAVTILLKGSKNTAVFQLIAAAKNYQKTAAVLLPITASINHAFALSLDAISYCIDDNNTNMKNLAQEILAPLSEYETKQHLYQRQFQ